MAKAATQLIRDEHSYDLGLPEIAQQIRYINSAYLQLGRAAGDAFIIDTLNALAAALPRASSDDARDLEDCAVALEQCKCFGRETVGPYLGDRLREVSRNERSGAFAARFFDAFRRGMERNCYSAVDATGEIVGELQAIGNTLYEGLCERKQ